MFVLSRNGRTLYPNQLIMMNAVMSDILNNQRGYINGSNNNYNSKILETQSIVAGLLESDKPAVITPSVSSATSAVNLSLYHNLEKGQPVTKELYEKNQKVFKEFNKALKLIGTNLQTQMTGLDPTNDAEILGILNLLKAVFDDLADIFRLIQTNNFLLSESYLIKINETLGALFNSLSGLTSSSV